MTEQPTMHGTRPAGIILDEADRIPTEQPTPEQQLAAAIEQFLTAARAIVTAAAPAFAAMATECARAVEKARTATQADFALAPRPPLYFACRRNDQHDAHEWQRYGEPLHCPGYPIPATRTEA